MARSVIQPSFAAGEFAPGLYARVDLAKFGSGAALLRNMFVDYRGGVSNRPGTAYIMRTKSSAVKNRLIPFVYSTAQAYALVFGDLTLRFVMNGGLVLETVANGATGPFTITNLVAGAITTSGATGWTGGGGDTFYVTGSGSQLDGQYFLTTAVGGATLNFTDLDGNSVTPVGWTGAGTISRVYTIATQFPSSALAAVKYTQSADTMTLTHPSYQPVNLTRTNHAAWAFSTISPGPTVSAPSITACTGTSGTTAATNDNKTSQYRYVVTALEANGVTESRPSTPANTGAMGCMSQTAGSFVALNFTSVVGATGYNIYRQREVENSIAPTGDQYGFVGFCPAAGAFNDNNITPDFTLGPSNAYNPFGVSDWPGVSTYYNGRQVYAGSTNHPQTLWASKTGDYANFDFSKPGRDDDGIEATLISQQVNAIQWMVSMNSLIVLTTSGAWKVDGGSTSDVITPASISAVPQSYNGASPTVPPITINNDILYVQSKGSTVRDLSYNFYVNLFTGANISVLSSHLFAGHQITEWAYADEPANLIWAVRDDGRLLCLTYLKEQEVIAWTHGDTQGQFLSVCTIPEGTEAAVYFIVKRYVNGQFLQYIERLQTREMQAVPEYGIPANLDLAWFVDAGLRYPLTYPAATLYPAVVSSDPTQPVTGTETIGSVTVIAGGSGYTAPTVTDANGSGATFSVTLSGGAITAVAVLTGGTVTRQPSLVIADGTGSGAILAGNVQWRSTWTASAGVFSGGDVGKVIRANNGVATILEVNSSASVLVDVSTPLQNAWPVASGSWSCTAPVTTVSGLGHLEGLTVSVLADGGVQPQQTVTSGAITLQRAASSIVVGLPYTAQLKTLPLNIEEPGGTTQGKRKQYTGLTVRMQDTRGLYFGPTFDELVAFKERSTQRMGQAVPPYTGDLRQAMTPAWQEPGVICLQVSDPLPATILGVIPEVALGDT